MTQVERGDTVWLFSQLDSPWGRLPSALDARIVVKDVVQCNCGVRIFTAARGRSTWYPLKDASALVKTLQLQLKRPGPSVGVGDLGETLGQSLQSMRLLTPDSATAIASHARAVQAAPLDFISYRHLDGTRAAFELVEALTYHGACVYWDRWSLPRRLTERRELVDDVVLDRHLMRRLAASARVWGVWSDSYEDPGRYAAKEMRMALRRGTFLPWA